MTMTAAVDVMLMCDTVALGLVKRARSFLDERLRVTLGKTPCSAVARLRVCSARGRLLQHGPSVKGVEEVEAMH